METRPRCVRRVLLFAYVLLPLVACGCLVTSNSNVRRSGNYVADSTLSQIEPGRTTAPWVRATLGTPSSVERLGRGGELWKYSYVEQKNSSGSVFLLFGGSDFKESGGTVFIDFQDGVVHRAWRG